MFKRYFAAVFVITALLATGAVAADSLSKQRTAFLAAERALERDDMREFGRLEKSLRAYPLHPYLAYQALRKRIDKAGNSEIKRFLKTYGDTPLAWRLRNNWLDHLASTKRWKDYIAFYEPTTNATRQCRYLQALIATGKSKQALQQVKPLWLHGKSQPSACDPVFAAWAKAGKRSTPLVWQRIDKAMGAGNWRLAEYLGRYL